MKRILLASLLAIALLFPATRSHAETYLSGYGALAIPHDADSTITQTAPPSATDLDGDVTFGPAFMGGLGFGMWLEKYDMPNVAVEINFDNTFPKLDDIAVGNSTVDVSGSVVLFTLTGNVKARLPGGLFNGYIRPYAGFGAGLYGIEIEEPSVGGVEFDGDSDKGAVGWQVFAGFDMPFLFGIVHENLRAYIEYRYMGANFDLGSTLNGVNYDTDMDYRQSAILSGMTWHFK